MSEEYRLKCVRRKPGSGRGWEHLPVALTEGVEVTRNGEGLIVAPHRDYVRSIRGLYEAEIEIAHGERDAARGQRDESNGRNEVLAYGLQKARTLARTYLWIAIGCVAVSILLVVSR